MRTLITAFFVLLAIVPYMLFKFLMNPIKCIKYMIADWKFVMNGDDNINK